VIKWVDVCDDGSFDIDAFVAALSPRTRMVAVTHMSNVLGTITPIKAIVAEAHARGIPVLIDGSQGAVHTKVDVQHIGADFYVMTGHKLYGPTGIGVLYGKYDLLAEMQPYQGGGEMIDTVTLEGVTYNAPPHRFEAGTPPIVQAIGLGRALEYMDELGREAIDAHEHEVAQYAQEQLTRINSLRMIGTALGKGGIFSFEIKGAHAHDVATILDRYGIAVRAGTHCAQPLLKRFGVTSTCRASFALYNGKDDVDALVDGIERAQKFFA
jgi:cysteine desulfurase/selenocysteine lyase